MSDIVKDVIKKKEEAPLHLPGGYTVLIQNDDRIPYQVVIEAICSSTNLSTEEATKRMMEAHSSGLAPVASYGTKDLAETVAHSIELHARGNTNYDRYRQHLQFFEPWPLQTEIMESGG